VLPGKMPWPGVRLEAQGHDPRCLDVLRNQAGKLPA
jgi:hypothetical protein